MCIQSISRVFLFGLVRVGFSRPSPSPSPARLLVCYIQTAVEARTSPPPPFFPRHPSPLVWRHRPVGDLRALWWRLDALGIWQPWGRGTRGSSWAAVGRGVAIGIREGRAALRSASSHHQHPQAFKARGSSRKFTHCAAAGCPVPCVPWPGRGVRSEQRTGATVPLGWLASYEQLIVLCPLSFSA